MVQAMPGLTELDRANSVGGAKSWLDDEFAQGGWAVFRPAQLTSYLRELQRPEGSVHLVGSDLADGWNGFIDGAIESGARVAHRLTR